MLRLVVIIKSLLSFHAIDLNVQDGLGNTPLHIAVDSNSFDAMDFLLGA